MPTGPTFQRQRRDDAIVWRPEGLPGVEALRAAYVDQDFRPHAHEGYLLGLIEAGVHSVWCRGIRNIAAAGTVATMNPGEVHHGGAGHEGGWRQRMLYVSDRVVADVLSDAADRELSTAPVFEACFRPDTTFAARFAALHELIGADEPLSRQSAFESLVLAVFRRHGRLSGRSLPRHRTDVAVARARDFLHANLGRAVPLHELAAIAGLRRRHLIEQFKARYGLPPHRYLLQLRIEAAKDLLDQGLPAADVAAETGFADQSHLTRNFRAIVGTTPARYGQAFAPHFRSIGG